MNILKSAALAAVIGMTVTPALAQEVTLRFQHFVSPNSANPKYFIEPWAKKVEAESGGRIKIEISPFMQLGGKAPEQYDLVRDGVIDGGWVIPGYQPGRFPEAEALERELMAFAGEAGDDEYGDEFGDDYGDSDDEGDGDSLGGYPG